MTYHAIVKREADHWVGWIAEMPEVRAQEESKEAVVSTLKASVDRGEANSAEPREMIALVNGITIATDHPADSPPYDNWKGLTLDEIADRQGIKPVEDPRSLLGDLTEEDFAGFDEFIREHRQSSMAGDSVL